MINKQVDIHSFNQLFVEDVRASTEFVGIEVGTFTAKRLVIPQSAKKLHSLLNDPKGIAFSINDGLQLLVVTERYGEFHHDLYTSIDGKGLYMTEVFAILQKRYPG